MANSSVNGYSPAQWSPNLQQFATSRAYPICIKRERSPASPPTKREPSLSPPIKLEAIPDISEPATIKSEPEDDISPPTEQQLEAPQRHVRLRLNPPKRPARLRLSQPRWPPVRNPGWEGPVPDPEYIRARGALMSGAPRPRGPTSPPRGDEDGPSSPRRARAQAPWMRRKQGGGMAYTNRKEEIRQKKQQYRFNKHWFGKEYADAVIY